MSGFTYTDTTPRSDSRLVYVSSSTGSAGNTGLSAASPLDTIASGYALLRDGYPDQLLLLSGDTFFESFPDWGKSGRSAADRMVIGAYGTGARPLLKTGTAAALSIRGLIGGNDRRNLVVTGLEMWAHTNDGSSGNAGITLIGGGGIVDDIIVEDCYVHQYIINVTSQGIETRPSNLKLRRTICADAIDSSASHRATGVLIGGSDGITFEECCFDFNGWNGTTIAATQQSHNTYVNPDNCTGVTYRGCISARASASGLRSAGSLCERCVLLQNPINITVGPDAAVVRSNLCLDSRDIGPDARGMGLDGTIGSGVAIYDNVFAHQSSGTGNTRAISIGGNYSGLRLYGNIVYGWVQTVNTRAPAILFSSAGMTDALVYSNDFQQVSGAIYEHGTGLPPAETFSNNRYYSDQASPFVEYTGFLTFAQWNALGHDSGSQFSQGTYPDPNRTVATYMAAIGVSGGLPEFMAKCRLQRRGAWDERFTADALNNYVREGFGLPPVPGASGTTTTTTVAPTTTLSVGTGGSSSVSFLAVRPGGPRIYWMIPYNADTGGSNFGLVPAAKNDLSGYLTLGDSYPIAAPYSYDALIARGAKRFAHLWLYGRVPTPYRAGASGFDGSDVLIDLHNEVTHETAHGRFFLDQIIPAFTAAGRQNKTYDQIIYCGPAASSSATDSATLLRHGTIARTLGFAQAYDSQSVMRYTDAANPHRMFVDLQYATHGLKTVGETWERRDYPSMQGWLARQWGIVSQTNALNVYDDMFRTGLALNNKSVYYSPGTIAEKGLRPMLAVGNSGLSPSARLGVVRQGLSLGCDVWLDGGGFTAGNISTALALEMQFNGGTTAGCGVIIPIMENDGSGGLAVVDQECDGVIASIDCCETTATTPPPTTTLPSTSTDITSSTTSTTTTPAPTTTLPSFTTQVPSTTPTTTTPGSTTNPITTDPAETTAPTTTPASTTPAITTDPVSTTGITTTPPTTTLPGITTEIPMTTTSTTTTTAPPTTTFPQHSSGTGITTAISSTTKVNS